MSNEITKKTFSDLINEYKIVIPLIQIDYAQGRESEKQKAANFLQAIRDGVNKTLNLDFIYGKTEEKDKKFIPLDGQQRLTTLFLIHWYLSLESEYIDDLTKFSYEVRSSSTDFIKELAKKENWENFSKKNIKEQIENSSWFFLSWKKDPTVVAILNMLESIESKFEGVSLENFKENITFETLYLEKFNLTDEIYVKMNARGKQLTDFENFKARFQDYIEKLYKENFEKLEFEKLDKVEENREIVKAKLDNEYLDIFWNYAKEKCKENIKDAPKLSDQKFYEFFYYVTFNFYLEKLEKFPEKAITIFDFYKDVFDDKIKVQETLQILDKLVKLKDEIPPVFFDATTNEKRAKLYASSLGYIYKLKEQELKRWERVSFNLIDNQLIQGTDGIIKTIRSLKSLIEDSKNDIYEFIKEKPENIHYFNEVQRKEESLKASLILDNSKWEQELVIAEQHWYLGGQIGFLLDFAENNFDKFIEYRDKFMALWNFDNKILIYQALLTKGNYLVSIQSNHTFCNFLPNLRDKMDNWRKVFHDKEKVNYLKVLLNEIDKQEVGQSLNTIIKNSQILDFRKYFIRITECISYCKRLQIKYVNEKFYLLSKTNRKGRHVELASYALFVEKFRSFQTHSSYHYTTKVKDEHHILFKNNNLDIRIYHGGNDKFFIKFSYNEKENFDKTTLDKIEERCKNIHYDNVLEEVKKVCNEEIKPLLED